MEKTLFVGDNVEAPIPYLAHMDLHTYVKTLEEYLEMDSKIIIAGHGGVIEESLIEGNIAYIEAFMRNDLKPYEEGACEEVHRINIQAWKEMMKK
jgi:glyoxylase-like metal-dependent hydrolase (beta-lactamase superfamily II)